MIAWKLYAFLALGGFAALGGSYWLGRNNGTHAAELACANATAAVNADALEQWKKAADEQRDIDQRARNGDALRAKAAADQAQAVADRFENMRIAIVKMPPKGECSLSPDWVNAFNAAK